jgi:hypothetical protein
VGYAAHTEETRDAYRFLVRKPSGTRPLGRPTCRWEDNITRHRKELGPEDVNLIPLCQGRDKWQAYVNMVMNPWVP